MEIYDGHIKYNDEKKCYGMIGHDGKWIKEALEDGDRIDVVINDERFSTNFKCKYAPILQPHAWDNWEFLTTIPAAYCKPKNAPEKKPLTKAEERRLRYKMAFSLIGISLAVCAVLGGIFAFMGMGDKTYLDAFTISFTYMFGLCGAGMVVGGILALMNILPVTLCVGFGCALYYGTVILAATLLKSIPGSDRYIISFTIVALVCYIVWLKNFKPTDAD